MKFLSAKNTLLLTAFLGCLPRPALGAPIIQAAEVTNSQVNPRGDDFSVVPVDQVDEAESIPHDEGGFYFEPVDDVAEVETRRWDPPRPPPPPPPPLPRPVPVPIVEPRPVTGPEPKPVAPPAHPPSPPRPAPQLPKPDWKPIPVDTNPGVGQGKGADPKPMENYERSGRRQVDNYETITKSSKPDTAIVQTEAELDKYKPNEAFLDYRKNQNYELVDARVLTNEMKWSKNFKLSELGFKIEPGKFVDRVAVLYRKDKGMVNRGSYDPDGNFIMYQDAFKKTNDDVAKKLPLNEIGMQNFINVAGDNTKNLKAAFLMDVQNKEFWAITRQNYNDMKQPFDQVLTFEHGTPQFNRYMGSPSLFSKFYSFGNHHNAIGNKIPDKVIVIPKQAEGSGGQLTVAVVFKAA